MGAYQRSHEMETALGSVASILKTSLDDVVPALERLVERQREFEKQLSSLRQSQLSHLAQELHARSRATCWWRASTDTAVSNFAHSPKTCSDGAVVRSSWSARVTIRSQSPSRPTSHSTRPRR